MRREVRLVFSTDDLRHLARKATNGLPLGVYNKPLFISGFLVAGHGSVT
jgi:hypothetical protein